MRISFFMKLIVLHAFMLQHMVKGRQNAHGSREIGAYVNSESSGYVTPSWLFHQERAEEGSAGWGCVETYINLHCAVCAAAAILDQSSSPT